MLFLIARIVAKAIKNESVSSLDRARIFKLPQIIDQYGDADGAPELSDLLSVVDGIGEELVDKADVVVDFVCELGQEILSAM